MKTILIALLLSSGLGLHAHAQESTKKSQDKEFTIENCVNEFSEENAETTKSGYRYWFADKDFIDGRTLKLSVVKPNQATRPPHTHEQDEFFFILEGNAQPP